MNKSFAAKGKGKGPCKPGTGLLILSGTALAALLLAAVWPQLGQIGKERENYKVVAKFDGMEVTRGEFGIYLDRVLPETFSYFVDKYGAEDEKGFWNKNFNGEIPENIAKERAMALVKEVKAEQTVMMDKGLMEKWNYKKFIDALEEENKRRKETTAQGGIVYGPQEYDIMSYFNYIHGNLVIKLKKKLQEEELKPDEKEMLAYYDRKKNSEEMFKKPDYIKTQYIEAGWGANGENGGQSRQKARETIYAAYAELKKGTAFEQVMKRFNDKGSPKERIYDEASLHEDLRSEEGIFYYVKDLEQGEASGIIETETSFQIIKCLERKPGGFKSFEETKEGIRNSLNEEKYKKYMAEIEDKIKVEIFNDTSNRIKIRDE